MSVQLNASFDQSCCPCSCGPSTTRTPDGRVQFENDNYQITVNDRGEVKVFNKDTGEQYRIWGDPHVEIDGKQAFDFWGQTTFQLEDGTKVTIETTPWRGNEDMTISSKVTITDGDYGVHITGVDDNTIGDLAFKEADGLGALMDIMVRDGNTIYENPVGEGFIAFDHCGNITKVDQEFINETDELKSNQFAQQLGQMMGAFTGLLSIAFAGAFLGSLAEAASSSGNQASSPHTRPVLFMLSKEW